MIIYSKKYALKMGESFTQLITQQITFLLVKCYNLKSEDFQKGRSMFLRIKPNYFLFKIYWKLIQNLFHQGKK